MNASLIGGLLATLLLILLYFITVHQDNKETRRRAQNKLEREASWEKIKAELEKEDQ